MKRSVLQLAQEFFIGRKLVFRITWMKTEGRGEPFIQKLSASADTYIIHSDWSEFGGERQFKDEIISDKIVAVTVKGHRWVISTLEGYTIEARFDEKMEVTEPE